MSNLKTDITENTTPILFKDSVSMDKLRTASTHSTYNKAVFVNTETGELYSADSTGSGGGSVETLVPYNQSMSASVTSNDGDLACSDAVALAPAGRVDVVINGLSVDLGIDKEAYFSGDGGLTARIRGDVQIGDFLYWNGSIAGYQLDINDVIDFDYLTSSGGTIVPTVIADIVGGSWTSYDEGTHILVANIYEEPPLESWTLTMDSNNYLKLFVSESATDLINVCQVAVGGVIETFTVLTPIGSITHDDKKVIDALFKTYIVNGLTITISRGANWPSFSL